MFVTEELSKQQLPSIYTKRSRAPQRNADINTHLRIFDTKTKIKQLTVNAKITSGFRKQRITSL